jgi:hypothetical protein
MTSPTLNPPAADAMMIGVRLDCREIDGGGSIGGGTTGDFADPLAGWFIRCSAVLAGGGAGVGASSEDAGFAAALCLADDG